LDPAVAERWRLADGLDFLEFSIVSSPEEAAAKQDALSTLSPSSTCRSTKPRNPRLEQPHAAESR
jgi:hypothetical protein